MNAQKLINKINRICKHHGITPKDLDVNYRWSNDSDVEDIKAVWEDLYDAETNSILTSITLVTITRDDT